MDIDMVISHEVSEIPHGGVRRGQVRLYTKVVTQRERNLGSKVLGVFEKPDEYIMYHNLNHLRY